MNTISSGTPTGGTEYITSETPNEVKAKMNKKIEYFEQIINCPDCNQQLEQFMQVSGKVVGTTNGLGQLIYLVENTGGNDHAPASYPYCPECGKEFSTNEVIELLENQLKENKNE